jgi:YesN/AraC family two-component response regulator
MFSNESVGQNGRLRVLIADDIVEMRRSTRLMLTLVPDVEVVAIAHNGREAVEMTHKHKPDIALMDVNMPEMDGLDAIKLMMQTHPPLVCVVVSAERDSETLKRAIASGARDYIIKPFTSDTLVMTMERVIRKAKENKKRMPTPTPENRQATLERLAEEYRHTRRSDARAMMVYEELARDPQCEIRWLTTLAMIYVIRREWRKLHYLTGRLAKQQ